MLITTIEEVRELLPVSNGADINRLKPHLEVVERDYIRHLLGADMYEELQEFYEMDPPAGLTEVQEAMQALLRLVQGAEVHLCYWVGFDVLNAYIADGGFKRTESNTVKGLFKYQEDNLKDYFKITGFNALDTVLEYLEGNIEHFGEFSMSDTWKGLKGQFIHDTRTFNTIYFIGSSRLTFLRLIPHMKVVEDLSIKLILGSENYDFIKSEMLKDQPEEKVMKILPVIQKPLAFLSVAMLIEESGADLNDKGLFFEGRMSNMLSDTVKQPAEIARVSNLVKRARGLGESYLLQLKQYLQDYAADWGGYTSPKSGLHNRDNTGKRTFWA